MEKEQKIEELVCRIDVLLTVKRIALEANAPLAVLDNLDKQIGEAIKEIDELEKQ
jgi:hypothetical protein